MKIKHAILLMPLLLVAFFSSAQTYKYKFSYDSTRVYLRDTVSGGQPISASYERGSLYVVRNSKSVYLFLEGTSIVVNRWDTAVNLVYLAPSLDSAYRLLNSHIFAINYSAGVLTYSDTVDRIATQHYVITNGQYWTLKGDSLYPTTITNSVGIGTATPTSTFQVYGNYSVPPFTVGKAGQTMIQTYQPDYSLSLGDLTFDDYGIRFDISDLGKQFSWGWWTDTAMTLKGQNGAPKLLTVNGAIWSLGEDSFTNFAGKTSSVIMLHNAIDHSQPGPCLYYSPDTSVHVLSGYCAKFLACSDINDYGDSSVAVMSAGDNQGNQCFMGLCGQTKKWALNLTGYQNVAFVYNDTSLWAVGSQLAGQPNPVSVLSANLLAQKVSITDGSQAQGTVLTGDSNGVATWGYAVLPHYIFTPTTLLDTVYTVTNAVNIINSTAATLVISLPSTPKNNDRVELKFNQAHAAITYTNGTINGGLASSVIGSFTVLTYDSANSAWY